MGKIKVGTWQGKKGHVSGLLFNFLFDLAEALAHALGQGKVVRGDERNQLVEFDDCQELGPFKKKRNGSSKEIPKNARVNNQSVASKSGVYLFFLSFILSHLRRLAVREHGEKRNVLDGDDVDRAFRGRLDDSG
jgi:hypothetical protein